MPNTRADRVRVLASALLAAATVLGTATMSSADEPLPSCTGNTNDPHKSLKGATAGNVKVLGTTECNMVMDQIVVETVLYKEVNGVEVYQATSPDPVATGKFYINRSAVGAACEPGWYTAYSYHSARLGTFRYANKSGARQYVSCS